MAKPCWCKYTQNENGECDGRHKNIRNLIADDILKWHTPEDNTSPCCYNDCTHEEDAAIARGEIDDN